jgi:glycosyltransferase involved in cell wall biosynthesis
MPKSPIHIGICSLPSNFHCRKWACALVNAGAAVTVFSFEAGQIPGVNCVAIPNSISRKKTSYTDYYTTSSSLASALRKHNVDVLHPLHLTPFGTWAVNSGFRPIVSAAIGADVLEFVPNDSLLSPNINRSWQSKSAKNNPSLEVIRRDFFHQQVHKVVQNSAGITVDNLSLLLALNTFYSCATDKLHLIRWGQTLHNSFTTSSVGGELPNELDLHPGCTVVLSPRGIKKVYNADIILAAFEHLLRIDANPNLRLIMLTAGYDFDAAIVDEADKLSALDPRFKLIKRQLTPAEMLQLWLQVDVFISAPVYDGYSSALAEGRLHGAIPIVNSIPGNIELIEHGYNGLVVDEFSTKNLTLKLQYAIDNKLQLLLKFNPINASWIEKNSDLHENAVRFLVLATSMVF